MKITTVVAGILVRLIFNNVQCVLVVKPKDAVAKIGHYMIMNCSSSSVSDVCGKILWKHFKPNSDSGDYINDGGKLSSSFASYISLINTSAGNCNLRINATPSAAGRYECFDGNDNGAYDVTNAQFIVLENDPEVAILKSHSGKFTLVCSVNYYGNWAPKVQWGKIVGASWTSIPSNDCEKSKSPVSSVIQMPSATFDSTGAREYFICNVTISKPEGSDMPIYNWMSLKNDTTCGINTEIESTTEGVNQGSCGGYCIAFIIFFVSTCGLLIVTILMYRKLRRMHNR